MSPKLPLTINTLKKYMYKPRVILSRVRYMVHYHFVILAIVHSVSPAALENFTRAVVKNDTKVALTFPPKHRKNQNICVMKTGRTTIRRG